ncbi:hypothetical protein OQA88_2344 [Cercophora sp. LCS_1]
MEASEEITASTLAQYTRIDLVYKQINNLSLSAAALIPNSILSSPAQSYPILVHFHGGALLLGTNPDPSFLSLWYLSPPFPPFPQGKLINAHRLTSLPLATPAIFISPAYRLLPEATGTDLLSDISSFWTWLHTSFPPALLATHPHIIPDLSRIACAGESAGGFLSIQSALLFQDVAKIKIVMAAYPAQYPDVGAYQPRREAIDENAERVMDEYMAKCKRGELPVRVSSPWPEMKGLVEAMCVTGRHREMMAGEEGLTLDGALRGVKGDTPGIWVIQGADDVLVPKRAADEVVRRIREALPGVKVFYKPRVGGHLFDQGCGLEETWVQEGMEFVREFWP